jgi:hypothetical protein
MRSERSVFASCPADELDEAALEVDEPGGGGGGASADWE